MIKGTDTPDKMERRTTIAMMVLLLAEILGSLIVSMVFPAMPVIAREFGSVEAAGWILTSFSLVTAATAAIGGRLGDMFGRKRVLIWVIVITGLGSLLSAATSNIGIVIAGRAIQGASGIILPLCYGMIRELVPPRRVPFWVSVFTTAYATSAPLGYLTGGLLVDLGSWKWSFMVSAILSAISLLLLIVFVPHSEGETSEKRFDVVGATLFAPAIAAILYGITLASKAGWGNVQSLFCVIAGGGVLAFWFWYEARHDDPLIDVRLLLRPGIAVANLCAALLSLGPLQSAFVLFMLLQQPASTGVGLGVSATLAALLKLPSGIVALLAIPIGTWAANRFGPQGAMVAGGIVCATLWGLLVPFHHALLTVVVFMSIAGLGNSLALVGLPNLVFAAAPKQQSSEATGVTSVVRALFAAIGTQTMALVLASSVVADPASGSGLPSDHAYQLTFGLITLFSIFVVVLALGYAWSVRRFEETSRQTILG